MIVFTDWPGHEPAGGRQRRDRRRVHVDEHHRDRGKRPRSGTASRQAGGSDITDEPVGALGLGQGPQVVIALLDRLDVVDHQIEFAVGKNGVHATQPFCCLWPGEERNDDPDGQRPTETQTLRGRALVLKPSSPMTVEDACRGSVDFATTSMPLRAREAVATLTPA